MTAEEVAGLDLRGCELAVLSACETGRGQIAGGEGVIGLQRAFHEAGARRVVASLWKVDDDATRRLMEQFYTALSARGRPARTRCSAARAAQLEMLCAGRAGAGASREFRGAARKPPGPPPGPAGRTPLASGRPG